MDKFQRIDTDPKRLERQTKVQQKIWQDPEYSVWENDKYIVHKHINRPMTNGSGILMTHLSIRNQENSAEMDWRDMQYIKNELCGEELEGVELFPKESRLIDTCNQFHIWVFQEEENFMPIGWDKRCVTDLIQDPNNKAKHLEANGSKQRPFSKDRKPQDNLKNYQMLEEATRIQKLIAIAKTDKDKEKALRLLKKFEKLNK